MLDPKVIVAMDFADAKTAEELADRLDSTQCRLKVGKELFVSAGPQLVEKLQSRGFEVFLDLKFHDIPNTVAAACRAAAELGVWMVNVHAMGGLKMMRAAVEAIGNYQKPPLLVAVTLLTSMDGVDLEEIGMSSEVIANVKRLSELAQRAGLVGVVCSAQEAQMLRQERGADFLLVTPGIRPINSSQDDQKRIMTPRRAIAAGADYLVIGRPITQAADPLKATEQIVAEL